MNNDDQVREYLNNLQPGERVAETTKDCATFGWCGTVYLNEKGYRCVEWDKQPGDNGQMSTSVTWGTRRL